MLNTGVNNNPGYSYRNRCSVVCEATSYTLPFGKKGTGQARQLNVCGCLAFRFPWFLSENLGVAASSVAGPFEALYFSVSFRSLTL